MTLRPDQEEVAKRLIELLRTHPVGALQAPTGWGKSYVAAWVIRQLGGKWIWTGSLLSALAQNSKVLSEFGVKFLFTAGREKMCVKGYRYADFITNPCNRCKFNVINTNTKKLIDELVKANINEYVQIKDMAEIKGFCPYYVQEQMVRRLLNEHDNLVVLMNYGRVRKFSRYVSNIVIDEAHNIMMPRVVRLPRKVINIILEKMNINTMMSAELIRDVLSEHIIEIVMDDEIKEVVNLDDIVRYIESDITYFDLENDEYVGVKVDEVPLQQQSRVILMSATIPPSLLSQFPVIRVPPSQQIIAKIPGWAKAITVEFIEKNKDVLAKKLRELLDVPSVIFTTTAKEIDIDDIIYEEELLSHSNDICKKSIMLKFYGRYSEGIRLNCYKRAILLTIPILPMDIMKRLRMRGISEIDIVAIKTTQSIGRIFPNDDYEVWLLDRRFWQYCQYLQQYGIQCVED